MVRLHRRSIGGEQRIDEDEIAELLEQYQLEIVDVIRTVDAMREHEDDPERKAYLDRIYDLADAYLQTFETDRQLYRER